MNFGPQRCRLFKNLSIICWDVNWLRRGRMDIHFDQSWLRLNCFAFLSDDARQKNENCYRSMTQFRSIWIFHLFKFTIILCCAPQGRSKLIRRMINGSRQKNFPFALIFLLVRFICIFRDRRNLKCFFFCLKNLK